MGPAPDELLVAKPALARRSVAELKGSARPVFALARRGWASGYSRRRAVPAPVMRRILSWIFSGWKPLTSWLRTLESLHPVVERVCKCQPSTVFQ